MLRTFRSAIRNQTFKSPSKWRRRRSPKARTTETLTTRRPASKLRGFCRNVMSAQLALCRTSIALAEAVEARDTTAKSIEAALKPWTQPPAGLVARWARPYLAPNGSERVLDAAAHPQQAICPECSNPFASANRLRQ